MKKDNIIKNKSYELALSIIKLVRDIPKCSEGYVICNQLCKSGTSVGANVEEAIAGFSKEDFSYKMNIALKEARESHYWLRLLKDSELVKSEHVQPVL